MKTFLLLNILVFAMLSMAAQTTNVVAQTVDKVDLHKVLLVEMTGDQLNFSDAADAGIDSTNSYAFKTNATDMRILFTIKNFATNLNTAQQAQFWKALEQFIKEQQSKLVNVIKDASPLNNGELNEDDFKLGYF